MEAASAARRFRVPAPLRAAGRTLAGGLSELFPDYCQEELHLAESEGWQVDTSDAYCGRCGASCVRSARTERGCPFCVGKPIAWDRIVRLGPYGEPMSKWILSMKFGRRWSWGRCFGGQLAQVIEDTGAPGTPPRTIVCAVPMHFIRRCGRGYNQAQLIADALARARGWPLAPLLRRSRHTAPQTSVPPSGRHDNIRASFAARRIDLSGWNVWLVDDVKTTGATLAACSRLLRAAGAERVNVAVAAVADPKRGDFKGT